MIPMTYPLSPLHTSQLDEASAPLDSRPKRLTTLAKRWQLITDLGNTFWKRWHLEYLNTLQTRGKWTSDQPNFEKGDIVLIQEDNIVPMQWPIARILNVFNGSDGIHRVRTAKGTYVRPVVKLRKLEGQVFT